MCATRGCKNTSYNSCESFHRFPKTPERLRKWLGLCKCKTIKSHSKVCSAHFKSPDFITTHRDRRIACGITPSRNLPNSGSLIYKKWLKY
jgi:hypothetical protein